jgi:hypothetical protein
MHHPQMKPTQHLLLHLGPFQLLPTLALFLAVTAQAEERFVSMIPNGKVSNCLNCHLRAAGDGPRNAFGNAVNNALRSNRNFWTASLAALDSDGDGFTNGEELGDPEGDGTAVAGARVTNPGDAKSFPVVEDTTAPILTLEGPDTLWHPIDIPFEDPGAAAMDDTDGVLSVNVEGVVDIHTLATYVLTYHAKDAAGNAATSISRTVHVVPASTELSIRFNTEGLVLEWAYHGYLQVAQGPEGPWTTLVEATSPHAMQPKASGEFFRVSSIP